MRTLLLLVVLLLQGRQAVDSPPPPRDQSLAGVVTGWDGAPLARRWVIARAKGRSIEHLPPVGHSNNFIRMGQAGGHDLKIGEGWPSASCTDDAGRFRIEGLAEGEYRIFLQAEDTWLRPVELTESPAATGSDDLQLRLRDQRLFVALSAGDRAFYPAAGPFIGRLLSSANVVCVRTDDEGVRLPGAPIEQPIEIGYGLAVFLVDPGHHYACVVDGEVLLSSRVWIEPGVSITRTRAAIAPIRRNEASAIHVRVTDPSGRPYTGDNQVRIFAEGEDEPRHESYSMHREPSYRTLAAPGTYLVQVSARDGVPMCGSGWRPGLARFGPAEAMCQVQPGKETVVDVQLVCGGRIELVLEAWNAVPPADEQECSRIFKLIRQGESAGAARVKLIPVGQGEEIPLEFTVPGCLLHYRSPAVLPGTSVVSHTIVPAGPYVLHARSGSVTWKPTVVHIRDEVTTAVRAPLR